MSRPLEIRNKVTGFLTNQLNGKKLHKAIFSVSDTDTLGKGILSSPARV